MNNISQNKLNRVAILGGKRIPFQRSFGKYLAVSPQELMQAALDGLVDTYNLENKEMGEVIFGAVMKHATDWNLARNVVVNSKLSMHSPAITLTRACGTSLDSAIEVANKIALGQIEVGIAGGCDTNSEPPIEFQASFANKLLKLQSAKSMGQKLAAIASFGIKDLKPNIPAVLEPATGLSMGQSCEKMAQAWNISREEQDQLAFDSHQKAAKAYEQGFMQDMIVEFHKASKDGILRPETSLEKLASLKTVFNKSEKASLTAGNSTALTDGAATVLLSSEEWAKKNDYEILAYLDYAQNAAVDFVKEEGLLMAPVYAVSKLLEHYQLSLQDFDFYEIHEAFAAQVLCTLKAWEDENFCRERLGRNSALGKIDRAKLNVNGSSLALGHPFAATGARILHTSAKLLNQNKSGKCLISICTAGGMGTTAIVSKD